MKLGTRKSFSRGAGTGLILACGTLFLLWSFAFRFDRAQRESANLSNDLENFLGLSRKKRSSMKGLEEEKAIAQTGKGPGDPLPSFSLLVVEYQSLSDEQINARLRILGQEIEEKNMIARANRNELSEAERRELRWVIRRENAMKTVLAKRFLANQKI